MTIRIAAIEVSHWHALNDAAYLRHLVAMPDVELVSIQDSDAGLVARRAAEVGSPPTFTDYRKMLETARPDFVVALGRHRQMAGIAHDLLNLGYPFLMEKPMGISASEVEAVAAKAAQLNAFVAVPLAQRYGPFATRARELLAFSIGKMVSPSGFCMLEAIFASSLFAEMPIELRGKPVIVVPTMAETTCAIAASYPAKAFGIKTGTLVYVARRLCPEVVLVPAHHKLYVAYHHRILEAIDKHIPVEDVMSIDEVACRLDRVQQAPAMAQRLAQNIKREIQTQVGECLTSLNCA